MEMSLTIYEVSLYFVAQSIYWNNLGLGNLNKDWLLPTFVKNASSHHSLTGKRIFLIIF